MRSIFIADVGDGLCVGVRTMSGQTIQIDCGSQQGSKVGFEGLLRTLYWTRRESVFVLSHFHIDHYNGLLYASVAGQRGRRGSPAIKEVYYPRIPDFERNKEFFYALFAVNWRIFGSETGIMEYDFLKAISRINRATRFYRRPVCQGDIIDVDGTVLEVLWPPKTIHEKGALSAVARALNDFERAREQDEITRRLYELVAEEGVFEQYFGQPMDIEESSKQAEAQVYREPEYRRELPQVVTKANESLREAANHMGLALFEDNRLLFLGDVEDFEITEIIDYLNQRRRQNFYVLITPHHGTHWDDSLRRLKCFYSVSSVGSKLCPKVVPGFKEISERPLATWVNGNIILTTSLKARVWWKVPWWSWPWD